MLFFDMLYQQNACHPIAIATQKSKNKRGALLQAAVLFLKRRAQCFPMQFAQLKQEPSLP
jgi:hypothetical protein